MVLDLKAENKEEAIKEIANKFFEKGYVKSAEDFEEGDKKGNLMLDKNLTRAEFTALLARLDGKDHT